MRVQFVRVPSEGSFGATDKVLMCVSEVENKTDPIKLADRLSGLKGSLGISAVLVTDEVVRFEPAQPEPDMDCDTQPEPLVGAELWDAATKVAYACSRTNQVFSPVEPGSAHGPCRHISCALDHCKCEHPGPRLAGCWQGCLRAEDCNHA